MPRTVVKNPGTQRSSSRVTYIDLYPVNRTLGPTSRRGKPIAQIAVKRTKVSVVHAVGVMEWHDKSIRR